MENLFYSENEKIAFWISGYDISTENVQEITEYLEKYSKIAAGLFNCYTPMVHTRVINQSRRYKSMRVFYAEVSHKPETAFEISAKNGWPMDKWLSD